MEIDFEERSSKGVVKDYFLHLTKGSVATQTYQEPPTLYKVLMDMVEADPILFAAVSLTVDLATYKGYDFIGKNKREIERAKKQFNETLDFDQVIDNILWQLLVYGDAFLEVRWNEGKTEVIELHPLETTEMKIQYDKHGDILYYIQKLDGKGEGEWIKFLPDEVIHFRQFWVGSQVYSKAPFKSISRSYATKVYANNYLQKIFINLPPKVIYFLKNANESQRKLFIENLIRAKNDAGMDIIAQGEAFDSKMMEPSFEPAFVQILEYLRKEILMITRVPPHWVGILDGANRGIGENVVIPYETKIKKLQQKVSSQINKILMPMLKFPTVEFKWNAISLVDEKEVINNMSQLSAQRFDSETIISYARERGLNLREEAYIEELMEPETQIQQEGAPSRQRKGKSDSMEKNINNKGVSQEGKDKLDQKKVVA